MNKADFNALDYFVAGVPAGILFKMSFDDIRTMVKSSKKDSGGLNTVAEVCLIGLVSYFEAFFKNHLASAINICPFILHSFCEKRPDVSLTMSDILSVDFHSNRVGFILAEKYDFGSAKSINSLYHDLLSITPFSKDDIKNHDQLLNDRNLLVHHAGIYTMKYHRQKFVKQSVRNRVFFDSLVVNKKDFEMWAKFAQSIVVKTIDSSFTALSAFIKKENFKLSKENKKGLEYLNWYG
jgi:hypothetical protein